MAILVWKPKQVRVLLLIKHLNSLKMFCHGLKIQSFVALQDTETQFVCLNTQELEWWFWQSRSLSASLCLLHSLPHCFCSCLSLFSPIQLFHRQNPEPSSPLFSFLLLSIQSCSYSAESLPGLPLHRATGGEGGGKRRSTKRKKKQQHIKAKIKSKR